MSDCMTFPDTVEEFMDQYKVVDTDGIYMSKGAELVPIFRMRQWFEHLPSAQSTQTNAFNTLNALDTIYRQAAIDALGEKPLIWRNTLEEITARTQWRQDRDAILSVPSAQQWIPVSERLPELDEDVLVTDFGGGWATVHDDSCGAYEDTGERFWYLSQNVIAWMPIPEPYKERREEHD